MGEFFAILFGVPILIAFLMGIMWMFTLPISWPLFHLAYLLTHRKFYKEEAPFHLDWTNINIVDTHIWASKEMYQGVARGIRDTMNIIVPLLILGGIAFWLYSPLIIERFLDG